MQILSMVQNEDGSYQVKVREAVPPVTNRTGYIPHFFHNYMIRLVDEKGRIVQTLGSGRTEREAVEKAEAWQKEHARPEDPRGDECAKKVRPQEIGSYRAGANHQVNW